MEKSGNHVIWRFLCDCGKEHFATATDVKRGTTKSCGCMQGYLVSKLQTKHGECASYTSTKEYKTWLGLKSRCNNPKNKSYADYGARGITVCERWLVFDNFLADMGRAPSGTSIDRIDNNRGYEPDNCRWANSFTQTYNRRNSLLLEIDGITRSIKEWSAISGMAVQTIQWRVKQGINHRDAVFTPPASPRLRRASLSR